MIELQYLPLKTMADVAPITPKKVTYDGVSLIIAINNKYCNILEKQLKASTDFRSGQSKFVK